jgi:hypothetical protein
MKISILIIALLTALSAPSATAQLMWHEGEATLSTGITVRGELCYQPQADALLFRRTPTDKWQTYSAEQLQAFRYVDVAANTLFVFTRYDVGQPTGDTRALLFEELIPGALVGMLRLPAPHTAQWASKQGLPRNRAANWQTPQPWYVWIDGRFIALDDFIENGLNALLEAAPESVQQWADGYARPRNPKALARWLAYFNGRVALAQPSSRPAGLVTSLSSH